MKVAFYTLGCKVNQYDSQAVTEVFAAKGYEVVGSYAHADIYVVNSCTVTAESDRKTRQAVRRFKSMHPDSIVVLTGCMPQAFPDTAQALPEADIVLGNRDYHALFGLLEDFLSCQSRQIQITPHSMGDAYTGTGIKGFKARTRAVVKIEDGCDRFCSYCIIPFARGSVRSKALSEIKTELEGLEAAGFLEIVLVGINLSAYGNDTGKSLCDVVDLACSFEKIKRVRLGSLEPQGLTDSVIKSLSKQAKLCPQFHLSLQSGCDETLHRMNRHYTTAEYETVCNKLRAAFKDCTLTTDVMVGFPTESRDEFHESLEFVKKIRFEKVHVFPYSPRSGTKAAAMKPQISKSEKGKRSRLMIAAAQEIRKEFLESQVGTTVEVLLEEHMQSGMMKGYTPNYTPVRACGENLSPGQIRRVTITGVENDLCVGRVVR
ncbi:MAG TPA: tRNA (N(6)-L-threonylcarbamoyladenosine(37)-C(2))-methylthiotransferase MtaB [Clostridia bacterium]|nr:tRNA (N(6)-L-threonylcarbamoyladenosine(37)-C(2))-methylthiotransferase MtaB [Clostridia bacterium]